MEVPGTAPARATVVFGATVRDATLPDTATDGAATARTTYAPFRGYAVN